jgi:hypothetical protein
MSGFKELKNQFIHYLHTLIHPVYWQFNVGFLLGIFGLDIILKKNRKLFGFLIFAFITNMFFALNYRIPDVDAYFVLSYIVMIIWISIALTQIYTLLKNKFVRIITITLLITVMIGIQFFSNYKKLDNSDNYLFYDYTKEVLSSVDSNAVILCDPLTPFVFPTWYFQSVEHFRKDVAVISTTLNQRWYLQQIGKYHEDIVDLEKNKFTINFNNRPVYLYSELLEEFMPPEGFYAVPDKYLFRFVDSTSYFPSNPPDVKIRFTKNEDNPYLLYIKYNIAIMLEHRLNYEERFENLDAAEKYVKLLRNNFPDFSFKSKRYNQLNQQ